MADDNGSGTVKLKVGEIPPNAQEDIGSGIVRIDSSVMEKIGVREGDAVTIEGDRKTVARVARSYPADAGLGIVRMDGYIRKNAGTSLRETVEVEKAELDEADKVVLAPAEEGVTIQVSSPSIFKRTLTGRAVTGGDLIVPSSGTDRRRSLFEDMFDLDDFFDFTFGETKLMVVSTEPSNQPVAITENTQIEVRPQAVEESQELGPRVPEVTYEDIGGLEGEIQKVDGRHFVRQDWPFVGEDVKGI